MDDPVGELPLWLAIPLIVILWGLLILRWSISIYRHRKRKRQAEYQLSVRTRVLEQDIEKNTSTIAMGVSLDKVKPTNPYWDRDNGTGEWDFRS